MPSQSSTILDNFKDLLVCALQNCYRNLHCSVPWWKHNLYHNPSEYVKYFAPSYSFPVLKSPHFVRTVLFAFI